MLQLHVCNYKYAVVTFNCIEMDSIRVKPFQECI